jgi:hypothetical protein
MMDYGGFIPTAQDFLERIEFADWMNNGRGEPPRSAQKAMRFQVDKRKVVLDTIPNNKTEVFLDGNRQDPMPDTREE